MTGPSSVIASRSAPASASAPSACTDGHPERLAELREARVAQRRRDGAAAERLLLDAAHVAERAVVEDDDGDADLVLDGRRHLLHVEHEAAVAVDRDDLLVRVADLRTERRREAVPERPLVPGGRCRCAGRRSAGPRGPSSRPACSRPRRSRRRAPSSRIASPSDACGSAALSVSVRIALICGQLLASRVALLVVLADPLGQRCQRQLRVGDDPDVRDHRPVQLGRVGVDADQRGAGGRLERHVPEAESARADRQHHVGGRQSARSGPSWTADSGCRSESAPRPFGVITTGASSSSATASSSSQASADSTPPPAMISGASPCRAASAACSSRRRVARSLVRRQRLAQLDLGLAAPARRAGSRSRPGAAGRSAAAGTPRGR